MEGELVRNYIHQLSLKQGAAFLLWPLTVVHIIDDKSPLFDFTPQDMMDFRLVFLRPGLCLPLQKTGVAITELLHTLLDFFHC